MLLRSFPSAAIRRVVVEVGRDGRGGIPSGQGLGGLTNGREFYFSVSAETGTSRERNGARRGTKEMGGGRETLSRREDGNGDSLADVISNLLTGPVYEWIRGKVIGPGGGPRKPPLPLPFYRGRLPRSTKPSSGLDLRLTLIKFVLWTTSRLTTRRGEPSSGAYKIFLSILSILLLAGSPSRRR